MKSDGGRKTAADRPSPLEDFEISESYQLKNRKKMDRVEKRFEIDVDCNSGDFVLFYSVPAPYALLRNPLKQFPFPTTCTYPS